MKTVSLLVLLYSTTVAWADCIVTPSEYVPNRTREQCVWATLETQARHWGMRDLYDLTAVYRHPSSWMDVCDVMQRRGRHVYWNVGYPDWQSLRNASDRHWPVTVGLWFGYRHHAVLLLHVGDGYVTILDNGDRSPVPVKWTTEYFAEHWDSWFVALDPEQKVKRVPDGRTIPQHISP